MRFLTGDDTGILKWVRVEAQKVEKLGGERRRGDAAERLCWGGPPENREARIVVAYASGALESRDAVSGQVLCSTTVAPKVRCLEVLGSNLLAISADGSANVVANWCGEDSPEPPPEAEEAEDGEADGAAGAGASEARGRRFTLAAPLADAHVDPCNPERLVYGGEDNDVKIYDLTRNEVTWKARNLRDTWIRLPVHNKITSLQWATRLAPKRSLILSSTKDGKIRLYDANAQRKPLFELVIGYGAGVGTGGYTGTADDTPRPVTCSTLCNTRGGSEWSLFVGNTMGVLREYDLRHLATCKTVVPPPGVKSHLPLAARCMPYKRGFKGIVGSLRAVDVHCSGEVLVTVGLGRHAYIFETRRRRMTSKVYLKQKLCSVLFSSEERQAPKSSDKEGEEEEEEGKEADEAEEGPAGEDEVQHGFSDDEPEAPGAGEGDEAEPAGEAAAEAEDGGGDEESDDGDAAAGGQSKARRKKRKAGAKATARKKKRKAG
mmetsp:Transcript_85992/g.267599  ORF Transcript_85992/g.267599 Transcript_85992/m.267599 type:complete len:490 (-) Transcript_85992:14-1483(-)